MRRDDAKTGPLHLQHGGPTSFLILKPLYYTIAVAGDVEPACVDRQAHRLCRTVHKHTKAAQPGLKFMVTKLNQGFVVHCYIDLKFGH